MMISRFIINPSVFSPFHVEVSQHIPDDSYEDGLTLLFFHALGLHKETYDVLILYLLRDIESRGSSTLRIKDAWCIDSPNHGRSALLNKRLLSTSKYRDHWSATEYAKATYSFLSASSHGVDFRSRKLVGIAHSAGAAGLLHLSALQPTFTFQAMVFLDPGACPVKRSTEVLFGFYIKLAMAKEDTWANRDVALETLKRESAFKYWHPQVLESFIEHAICAKDDPSGVVTLACSRAQELGYLRSHDIRDPVAEIFIDLATKDIQPIHLILSIPDEYRGKGDDVKTFQTQLVSKMKTGSIQTIDRGGHMFPQIEPARTSSLIRTALSQVQQPLPRL